LLVTIGQSMFWSAYFTLIAEIGALDERDRWYGLVGALRASGVGLGGFLAGFVVAVVASNGYHLIVVFNGLSFFLAAGLVLFGVRETSRRSSDIATQGYRMVMRDKPFLLLIIANACFALCSNFLYLAMPVYLTIALKMPIWFIGIVLAFATTFIATVQTVMVHRLESFRRTRALMVAGGLWCAWCLASGLALFMPRFLLVPYFPIVVCIYGLAQMIHTPTSNALAAGSSPEAVRGRYLAVFQYSFFIANLIGPSLFAFLFTLHPGLPWLVVACIAIAGSLAIYWVEQRLPRQALRARANVSELTEGATLL